MRRQDNEVFQIMSEYKYRENTAIKFVPRIPGLTLTRKIIKKVSILLFKDELCPICLCQLSDQKCGTLECKHTFHYSCIDKWLRTSAICCVCRKPYFITKKKV